MNFLFSLKFLVINLISYTIYGVPEDATDNVVKKLLELVKKDGGRTKALFAIFNECEGKPEDISIKMCFDRELANRIGMQPFKQNYPELLNENFFLLKLVKEIHEKCGIDFPFLAIDCYVYYTNKSLRGLKILNDARRLIEETYRHMDVRKDTVVRLSLYGYMEIVEVKNTFIYFNNRLRNICIFIGDEILGKVGSGRYNKVTVSSRHYSMLVISLMVLPNNLTIFYNVFLKLPKKIDDISSLVYISEQRIFYADEKKTESRIQESSTHYRSYEFTLPTVFGEAMYFETDMPITQTKPSSSDNFEDVFFDHSDGKTKYRYIFVTTMSVIFDESHLITRLLGIAYHKDKIVNLTEPFIVTPELVYRYISHLHRTPINNILGWLNHFKERFSDNIATIPDFDRMIRDIRKNENHLEPRNFNFRKNICELDTLLSINHPLKLNHMIGVFSEEKPRIAHWNDLYSRLANASGERINEYTNIIDFKTEPKLECNSRNDFLIGKKLDDVLSEQDLDFPIILNPQCVIN